MRTEGTKKSRRRFLASVGSALGATSLAGCQGLVAGRPRWKYQGKAGIYAQPAIDDASSLVFYVSGREGLVALDQGTGEQRWTVPFEADRGQVHSEPRLYEGSVITASSEGTVYSVTASDGTIDWEFPTDGRVLSSPVVTNGVTVVGSTDHRVYAIEADSGSERWVFETGDQVRSSPVVVDDTVYIGSHDTSVYALDVASGTVQWSVETGEMVFGRLAATEDTVFVGRLLGFVYAFDVESGDAQRWTVPIESQYARLASPVVHDGNLFVVEPGGIVHALDAATGEHGWRFDSDGGTPNFLAVDDRMIAFSSNKTMYALSPSGGRRRWSFSTEDKIFARPALTPDSVYVASEMGRLSRLRRGVF